ncbi:MAG: hypothetical protein JNJ54_14760 [Myxococcaceae bacterium]|nr:hypothetical protein [Myxococcaceae bacterium]
MRVLAVTAAVVAFWVAAAAPNPKIGEGRKLLEDLELEKAARTLAAAESQAGNDRAQVLEILELQAVVYGTMNKEAKARDAFRELLTLNPGFKLPPEHPPRVRTPFYEAKEWVAQNEPLKLEQTATTEAGVTTLTLSVKKDLLRLVKKARFVLTDGPAPQVREAALEAGLAKTTVEAPKLGWTIQVLGARDAIVIELGPFTHEVPTGAPVSVEQTRAEGNEGVSTAASAPASPSPLRPVGYALFGAGVVAAGVGVVFGVLANGARARVTGATQDGQGLITSLTQRQAQTLEQQARSQAVLANVLFGVGGALAAAGVVLFFVGAPTSEAPVSLTIAPGGVVVTGAFP